MPDFNHPWILYANGFKLSLNLTVDANSGQLLPGSFVNGSETVTGFWDEASQKLSFLRIPSPLVPGSYQAYTGYFYTYAESGGHTPTFTGFFKAFNGSGATAGRNVFGWIAVPDEV